ncbi:hypothetical protein KQX54_005888 [Cotesia glomerata]|uniref:Uncharacterized protein n=1 Tax=Cotesia glomerata TaxID=32391 RepID=A0AAV7IMT4_COTGL|nr:hypothetical protein KQX54_005888 [Cotesia glomerata]
MHANLVLECYAANIQTYKVRRRKNSNVYREYKIWNESYALKPCTKGIEGKPKDVHVLSTLLEASHAVLIMYITESDEAE